VIRFVEPRTPTLISYNAADASGEDLYSGLVSPDAIFYLPANGSAK